MNVQMREVKIMNCQPHMNDIIARHPSKENVTGSCRLIAKSSFWVLKIIVMIHAIITIMYMKENV